MLQWKRGREYGTVVAFVCGFGVFRIPALECRVQSFGEFWSVGVGSFSVEFWIWSWHSVKVGLDFENGPSNDISSNGTYVAVYVCPRKSTTLRLKPNCHVGAR